MLDYVEFSSIEVYLPRQWVTYPMDYACFVTGPISDESFPLYMKQPKSTPFSCKLRDAVFKFGCEGVIHWEVMDRELENCLSENSTL